MQSDIINENAACPTTDVGNEMAVNGRFEGTPMSTTASDEPKLFFPGLAGFYASISDLWYPLIRVGIGAILFVHGWGKLNVGVAYVTNDFAKNGFVPANGFALAAIFLETIGAVCVMLGLFTRFFAAALTIGLAIVFVMVHLPNGFEVRENGFEYVLLEGIVMLAIVLRGGGPYSLDRIIGKQL
jgi:putative oxidoreductase